jgi:hypothetical protein
MASTFTKSHKTKGNNQKAKNKTNLKAKFLQQQQPGNGTIFERRKTTTKEDGAMRR